MNSIMPHHLALASLLFLMVFGLPAFRGTSSESDSHGQSGPRVS